MHQTIFALCSLLLACASGNLAATPLGTAFTYNGRLTDGANAANGTYFMFFTLHDALQGGNQLASQPTNTVSVINGLFTVDLDFGVSVFTGEARWLQISVRTNGGAGVDLSPRTRVAPTPNAIYASTAGALNNGAIQASQLDTTGEPPAPDQVLGYNGSSLFWKTLGNVNLWSLSGSSAYYNGGNVGIGAISPSAYGHGGTARILEINNSNTALHSQAHVVLSSGVNSILDSSIGTVTWAQPGGMAAFIGAHTRSTTSNAPAARLVLGTRDVADGAAQERMVIHENGNVSLNNALNFGARLGQLISLYDDGVNLYGLGMQGGTLYSRCGTQPGDAFAWHKGGTHVNNSRDPGTGGKTLMTLDEERGLYINGKVGIGTFAPQSALEVIGQDAVKGVGFQPFFTLADSHADYALSRVQGVNGEISLQTDAYIKGSNPNAYVHINSQGNISVASVTIRGGADLAEPFQMATDQIPKGAVVVIDDESAGKLKLSTRTYDNRVAGIVSGANGINTGIALHQEGALEGGQNVALSGRVYVQADASGGPIKPGDLLTTSNTPGHAMKVTDHARAQGAIIGKAMSALKEGKGMVLVLVSLQ